MPYRIERETCIGCGVCASMYPELFQMDDENKAVVQDIPGVDDVLAQDAMNACPVNAILDY